MHNLTMVDADHEDEEILTAFAKACKLRAQGYANTDRGEDDPAGFVEDESRAYDMVQENWATTPIAAAAQLALMVPQLDTSRWIDRGLVEQGLSALYYARHRIEGAERQLVLIAFELVHMEWDQALGQYQRARDDCAGLVATMQETLTFLQTQTAMTSRPVALIEHLTRQVHELGGRRERATKRLIRTLAPDFDEYKIKAEICAQEGAAVEASTWLVRDVNFLTGRLQPEEATNG